MKSEEKELTVFIFNLLITLIFVEVMLITKNIMPF